MKPSCSQKQTNKQFESNPANVHVQSPYRNYKYNSKFVPKSTSAGGMKWPQGL